MIGRTRRRGDVGQVTVLIIGFVGVVVMLISVVTCASSIYLARRSLAGAADGAALAAASALDEAAVYSHDTDLLPLDEARAKAAVADYARAAALSRRFDDFAIDDVRVRDGVVTVTLRSTAHLPYVSLGGRYRAGVALRAQAVAQAPLR